LRLPYPPPPLATKSSIVPEPVLRVLMNTRSPSPPLYTLCILNTPLVQSPEENTVAACSFQVV
jgi:hypothetical protein